MKAIDFKHNIAGQPYRVARRIVGPSIDNDPELLTMLMGVGYTAAANLAAPLAMIQSGVRGERYFAGLSIGRSSLGFPMPLFNYITPMSPATRWGMKFGGGVGGIAMQSLGHVTPLVGWMPMEISKRGIPMNLVKLPLSPWIKKAGVKTGAKIGGRVAGRLVPGLGWGLLAYDVYDIAFNQSLWGFDLS